MKPREKPIFLKNGKTVILVKIHNFSRERKSNFSLDFLVFGQSVLVEPRSKVVLRGKGYAWAPVLGSFDNFKR